MTKRNYFTKSEAAAFLGIEKWVLDDLRDVDLGPHYILIGKKIRYYRSDVREWGTRKLSWIH